MCPPSSVNEQNLQFLEHTLRSYMNGQSLTHKFVLVTRLFADIIVNLKRELMLSTMSADIVEYNTKKASVSQRV